MRKYLLGFASLALLALFTTTGHTAPELKEYSYPDLSMAFSMPGEPKVSTQTIDSAVGPIALHIYMLDQGDSAMMVGANDYPDQILKADPVKVLEGARDGAMTNMKCKVTSQKTITLDGNPGLEFEFEGDTVHGTYRIYLVSKRLYQIASFASKGAAVPDGTAEFIASFHLLKAK